MIHLLISLKLIGSVLPLPWRIAWEQACCIHARDRLRGRHIGCHLVPLLGESIRWSLFACTRVQPWDQSLYIHVITKYSLLMHAQGITLMGMSVTLSDTNPFIIRGYNGQETPTTRVLISDVSLSHTNKDIEATLLKLGFQLMSPLGYECDWDTAGKLTRFKTSRRYVFAAIPAQPLPREDKIAQFQAKIYHQEQTKETRK